MVWKPLIIRDFLKCRKTSQAEGRGFESRLPLNADNQGVTKLKSFENSKFGLIFEVTKSVFKGFCRLF